MVHPGFDSRGWYWVAPINSRTFGMDPLRRIIHTR